MRLMISNRIRTLIALSLTASLFFQSISPALAATSPWSQTDWSGGSGQASWSDATKYDSSTNLNTSTSGQVTLGTEEQLQNTGFESNLDNWSASQDYLLRDEFSSDLTAGNVDGTSAEPGPGTRETQQNLGNVSVGTGYAVLEGYSGSYADPVLYYDPITRAPGRSVLFKQYSTQNVTSVFGLSRNPLAAWNTNLEAGWTPAGNRLRPSGLDILSTANGQFPVYLSLRNSGAHYMRFENNKWLLDWTSSGGTSTTVKRPFS